MGLAVPVVLVVLVLAVVALLNNRLARRAYLLTSLTATAVLLAVYARTGLGRADAGLVLGAGLWWAPALVALTGLGFLGAVLLPATRRLFVDRRAEDTRPRTVAYEVLVRIPFGTVLFEEVAFRGVLYGLLSSAYGTRPATVVSSALFGLWHVPPSRDLAGLNPSAARLRRLVVPAAVLGTAAAGVLLCEVRRRSGTLLAPIALHWSANAFAYLAALAVTRRAGRSS
jgi:membrane protease YdiL (CAAX protease family)